MTDYAPFPLRWRPFAIALVAGLILPGCHLGDLVFGESRPAAADLVEEEVIIRHLSRDPSGETPGAVASAFLDRTRFLVAGDLKSIDRVVLAHTRALATEIDSLALAVGDTVVVTTEYAGLRRGGTPKGVIPDWPGTNDPHYLMGHHRLKEVRRKP